MRFAVASAAVVGVAAAQWGPGPAAAPNATASDIFVTEVVTAFTTFCPVATQFSHAGSTYTVSQATTLTITNCPGGCTITRPSYSSATPVSSSPVAPVSESTTPVAPAPYTSASASESSSVPVAPAPYSSAPVVAPYPSSNGTTPAGPVGTAAPSGTTSTSTSSPMPYTGAANKVSVYGAGFLALFGLVAAL